MQQITPVEIRQKSFDRSFRGYNINEVNAFLHSLAYAWEKLLAQLDEVEVALEDKNKEVKRLQGVENALLKTVKDAEVTAHNIIAQAKKEADLKARETAIEAERMIREAQDSVKNIGEENERRHQQAKERMARELEVAKKLVHEVETYRATLLQKLRHLAEDILTRGQLIERNFQRDLDIDEEHKENSQEQGTEVDVVSPPSENTPHHTDPAPEAKPTENQQS